jgi:flagellar basal body-associated protein FliL
MAADPIRKDKKPLKKSGSGSRGGIFVLVVIMAGIAFWYWNARATESSAANAKTHVLSTLHLETFILNLADTDQRSFLRVGIDLGLNRELKRNEVVPVAQVRDTILGVLGEAKVDGLMTPVGKTKLKDNVLRALQERAPNLGVEEVYFTEFLIQR